MNNKRWTITIFSVIALAVISIGATVYFGTFVQPNTRKTADIKACDTFFAGVLQARDDSMAVAQKTPAGTDQEVAAAYLKAFDKGLSSAFEQAATKSDVYQSLAQLSLTRVSYDASMGFDALNAIEAQFTNIQTSCSVVEPTPTASSGN